jgi:hypothetical protein
VTRPPGTVESVVAWAEDRDAERARQAEMDAARARELAEETQQQVESDPVYQTSFEAMVHEPYERLPAKVIREFVRGHLVLPVLRRMYGIGMGTVKFEVPTMVGTVVQVAAPASVQRQALKDLLALGLPPQASPHDSGDDAHPGVLALGELELDEARRAAHGERYITPGLREIAAGMAGAEADITPTGDPAAPPPAPMSERVARGEFEIVEVEDGEGVAAHDDRRGTGADRPAEPAVPPLRLEDMILAKRRAARRAKASPTNGHRDPRDHPEHPSPAPDPHRD